MAEVQYTDGLKLGELVVMGDQLPRAGVTGYTARPAPQKLLVTASPFPSFALSCTLHKA
jgi:hypothetical protein